MLIGIDEVGRGAWAGPLLVVAASCETQLPDNLDDSKKLSAKKREQLHTQIKQTCILGSGWVSSEEIDSLGLSKSMFLAVERALAELQASTSDKIIIDGSINYCPKEFINVKCEPKADSKYPIVSAASIYAKVERDRLMASLAIDYPDYGFEKHVGYGTKLHSDAIKALGINEHHRKSFNPLKDIHNASI